MISRLAKAHESLAFKIISAAVAVSFISLFGVTGYITSASQNKTIIKVGHKKTTQSEFSYRLQRELSALKNLGGDDFELSDEMRNMLTETLIKQIIDDSVLDEFMDKYNIQFPRELIQQVLFSQKEFINPLTGQFSPDIFNRFLSQSGMTESEYVKILKRMIAKRMLVSDLVNHFNIPTVLSNAVHRMDNQRKSFRYVLVSSDDIKIERKISDDEIKQYFEDFSETFMVPEKRDAKVLFVPLSYILDKYAANEDLVKEYFDEHKAEFQIPEKREVSQMVFLNQETAKNAFDALNSGKDFLDVAKEFNAENADAPTLGLVSEDELAEDLATATFKSDINTPQLLEVADTWQIIRVERITPAKEANFEEAKSQIKEILASENLYDAMRDVRNTIDEAVNNGKDLNTIGRTLGIEPINITNIAEDALISNVPEILKQTADTRDLNELAFSYGLHEISSSEEFDDGIAILEVTNIIDAHMPDIDDVKDQIITLWTVQERDAIAKEIADNIMTDIKDGTTLIDAAKARGLEVFRSEPISRNETFANLSTQEMTELFLAPQSEVKIFEHKNNNFVVAESLETINFEDKLTEANLVNIKQRVRGSFASDMYHHAMDNYAKDFKITVDYKLAGFED